MDIESIMREDVEIVRRNLSKEQRKDLMNKIEYSGLFKISQCKFFFIPLGWRVNVKNIKEGHPKPVFFGYLPVGFIRRNAELVNLFEPFPEDYHSELRKIYYSVENP